MSRRSGSGDTSLSAAGVEAIEARLRALYASGAYPALTFCLRHRGRIVIERAFGHADGFETDAIDKPRPATLDTPVCLFSASKAITAVLIHKLAEEGGIDLDHAVARYLPAFAADNKARISIADLLAHRGGLDTPDLGPGDQGLHLLGDWDACVARVCATRARPGGRIGYQPVASGYVLGEVIRRVSGMALTDYATSRLREPMGMRYFNYGLAPAERNRVARNTMAGWRVRFPVSRIARRALSVDLDTVVDWSNQDAFMAATIPSANIYATAEELSRFFQMLADDGRYRGRMILAPATVRRAVAVAATTRLDATLGLPMRYSEGFMLGADPVGFLGPMTGAAFGHYGLMNIVGWADPARSIAAGLMATGKSAVGPHLWSFARLLNAVARHIDRQ